MGKGQPATEPKKTTKVHRKNTAPVRLWVKASFIGFRRSKVTQNEKQALLKIQHVQDVKAATYYFGKRVAYIFKAKSLKKDTKYRVIWGRIASQHGTNGIVKARFRSNLPPRAMGSILRVMLYPNRDTC